MYFQVACRIRGVMCYTTVPASSVAPFPSYQFSSGLLKGQANTTPSPFCPVLNRCVNFLCVCFICAAHSRFFLLGPCMWRWCTRGSTLTVWGLELLFRSTAPCIASEMLCHARLRSQWTRCYSCHLSGSATVRLYYGHSVGTASSKTEASFAPSPWLL